jgi:DNA polymerase-3 subunit delta
MTELLHSQLASLLADRAALEKHSVGLIHGEPMLVEQCAAALIERLLQGAPRDLHCEVVDGLAENIPDALARMNTFALLSGPKVVWFKEARLFDAGGGQERLIDQILEAYAAEQMERAAKSFLGLCARTGLDILSVGAAPRLPGELQPIEIALGEEGIARMIDHCRDQGWRPAGDDDPLQSLSQAIEKGFPDQHFLLITTGAKVPKNRKFYKSLLARGLIIDCHVPLGERKADKLAQEAVLRQIWERQLQAAGKRMAPALFSQMGQLTGFDPATFRDNIDKLIDYSGARPEITAADLEAVLRRTKSDPVYELTNAVADRNLVSALFFLDTLLKAEWHPLQMLAALANQIRKLLVAKDFVLSEFGRGWRAGMSYPQFQNTVLAAIQSFDARISAQTGSWLASETQEGQGRKGSKRESLDLALASNPGNAYPVYQTLLKTDNFGRKELVEAMIRLSETDLRLKSSAHDAAVIMRNLIMTICGLKGKASRSDRYQ